MDDTSTPSQAAGPLPLTKEEREALVAQTDMLWAHRGDLSDEDLEDIYPVTYARALLTRRYEATVAHLEAEMPALPPVSSRETPAPPNGQDEPVLGMVYVSGDDSLAVVRTVGGEHLLVDHNDDSRPLARFVNEDSAQVVNRILSRVWAGEPQRSGEATPAIRSAEIESVKYLADQFDVRDMNEAGHVDRALTLVAKLRRSGEASDTARLDKVTLTLRNAAQELLDAYDTGGLIVLDEYTEYFKQLRAAIDAAMPSSPSPTDRQEKA